MIYISALKVSLKKLKTIRNHWNSFVPTIDIYILFLYNILYINIMQAEVVQSRPPLEFFNFFERLRIYTEIVLEHLAIHSGLQSTTTVAGVL